MQEKQEISEGELTPSQEFQAPVVEQSTHNMPVNSQLSPLVQAVMDGRLTTEQMRDMLEIQKDYEAMQAKKAYDSAVAAFKLNAPDVLKDKKNTQFDSQYISKAGLVNVVNKAMSPHGLNSRWDIHQEKDGMITVTCYLTHVQGHTEKSSMSAPPDQSGKKNVIQQIKSTKTYLEIATYESVTGIAASENGDDDGQGYRSNVEYITDEQLANLHALMEEVGANKPAFLRVLKVEEFGQLPSNKLQGAITLLEGKRKNAS